jgi:hypothetical protein
VDTTNPKDLEGMKKPPLRLVPPALILWVSKAFEEGARKYGAFNWRAKSVRRSIYIEAAMRHLLALQDGEDVDPESGLPHECKAAACLAILLDARETGNLIDDRPPPGPAAELIRRLTVNDGKAN